MSTTSAIGLAVFGAGMILFGLLLLLTGATGPAQMAASIGGGAIALAVLSETERRL